MNPETRSGTSAAQEFSIKPRRLMMSWNSYALNHIFIFSYTFLLPLAVNDRLHFAEEPR